MRKTLIAAVALAPICFMASSAGAATTISSSRTTAVDTATVNAGAADDLVIASGATLSTTATTGTVASPYAIVTLNSNNTVSNAGTLSTKTINNVVGILVQGGRTGGVTNAGAINLTTDFTAATNANGYTSGPMAGTASATNPTGTGDYGLYGIRLTGSSPFVGGIANAVGGTISIKGNNSYGISIEAPVTGTLTNGGTISVVGDNNVGLRTTAGSNITGNVILTGSISSSGKGSSAVSLGGDVSGRLSLNAAITSTGYTVTGRPSDPALLAKVQDVTNRQVDQAGTAFAVGGNVGAGIYIGGVPSGTVSGSTADLTGDGTFDGSEGVGSITAYGSAPALLIGSTTGNTTIGGFVGAGTATQDNGYGLVIRGSVASSGIFDRVVSNAIQIGAGGGTVNLSSGITVYGAVSSSSYSADSYGLHLLSAVSSPNLIVSGSISAAVNDSSTAVTAYAVDIGAGSNVQNLTVTGAIVAATVGNNASAYAVRDASGTITNVLNEGTISATNPVTNLGDVKTGKAVALDLSASHSNITLVQKINPNPNHDYGSVSGATTTATTSLTATTPSITGDVLLGSGTNRVSLLSGNLTGALAMGSGTGGSLLIDNGATLEGGLTFSGTGLTINVNNGKLLDRSATTVNVASLNVGAGSTLSFAVDPANNSTSKFVSTGAVNIATGAKLGLTLLSTPTGAQSFTLIQAPSLSMGATDTSLLSSVPYLLSAGISSNVSAGTVTLDIRRKTTAELGLNTSESAMLNAAYAAAGTDSQVRSVLLAPTAKTPFLKVYDQMMPDSSGGVFEAARATSDSISRATAAHDQIPGAPGSRGFWAQQIVVGGHSDRTDQNSAYDMGGFGVVGGLAFGGRGMGAYGLTAAFATVNVTYPDLKGDSQQTLSSLEAGAYWQASVNHLTLDARLGAGWNSIAGRRQFYAYDVDGNIAINRKVKDNRDGYSLTAHLGAGYEQTIAAGFYVRPQIRFDYFSLNENAYKETDTVGTGFALNVNSRNGSASSGTASVVFGRTWGTDFRVRPEFELGVRDTFSGDAGKTTAKFVSGTTSFTLTPSDISGSGGIARFGLKAATDFYEIGLQAGTEVRTNFYSGDVRATFRLLF